MTAAPPEVPASDLPTRRISGRKVVTGMFGFAILATGFLWFYWNRHLEPFMPLQMAIEKQFEGSRPRVDGGQRRMSKRTPRVLRVVLRVPFDPEDPSNRPRVDGQIREIARIAEANIDLRTFEIFTVHMYQENPGNRLRQKTFETPLTELLTNSDR